MAIADELQIKDTHPTEQKKPQENAVNYQHHKLLLHIQEQPEGEIELESPYFGQRANTLCPVSCFQKEREYNQLRTCLLLL